MITFTSLGHTYTFNNIEEIDREMGSLIDGYNAILWADPNNSIAGYESIITNLAYEKMNDFRKQAYLACGYCF